MTKALSVIEKRQLAKDSNSPLKWVDLDMADRRIILAVTLNDGVENARKAMKLSIGGFYKRWHYLKPIYNNLLNDLPNQAVNIMKSYSVKAAHTLGENLEAEASSDQIKAANSILDRTTPQREEVAKGVRRQLTLVEWINMSDEEQEALRNQE